MKYESEVGAHNSEMSWCDGFDKKNWFEIWFEIGLEIGFEIESENKIDVTKMQKQKNGGISIFFPQKIDKSSQG